MFLTHGLDLNFEIPYKEIGTKLSYIHQKCKYVRNLKPDDPTFSVQRLELMIFNPHTILAQQIIILIKEM